MDIQGICSITQRSTVGHSIYINNIYDTWFKIFYILNEFAPIKQKRVKRKCQPVWFTSKLNNKILERNNLLKKARKSQRVKDWSSYKVSKNRVTRLIRQSKKDYFKTKMAEN